jgi:hypothetical protein
MTLRTSSPQDNVREYVPSLAAKNINKGCLQGNKSNVCGGLQRVKPRTWICFEVYVKQMLWVMVAAANMGIRYMEPNQLVSENVP